MCILPPPLVSVIIPAWNTEAYVGKSIDSVLAQTFDDWELILVDDGSTDGTGGICDAFVQRDSRVHVIHHPVNQGLSAARNTGLAAARGEWIAWLDSDDYLQPTFLETLLRVADERHAQIVTCSYTNFDAFGKTKTVQSADSLCVFDGRSAVAAQLYSRRIGVVLWGRIARRFLYEGISFPVGRICEDVFVSYKLYARAKTVACVPQSLVMRLLRPESLTHDITLKIKVDKCLGFIARNRDIHTLYPEFARDDLIKSIVNCLPDLRDRVVRDSPAVYREYRRDIRAICRFYRRRRRELLDPRVGPLGRLLLTLMTCGLRQGFLLSAQLERRLARGYRRLRFLRHRKTPPDVDFFSPSM